MTEVFEILKNSKHKMIRTLEEAFRNQQHGIFTKASDLYYELYMLMKKAAEARVICDYHLGRFQEGISFLDQCIRFNPLHATPYAFSILYSLLLGHPDKAQSNANVAMLKFPENVDFKLMLSIVHQHSNNYDDSLHICNEVLEKDPMNTFGLILKGDTLKYHPNNTDPSQHLSCYKEAIKLDAVCAPQYIGRGFLSRNDISAHVRNTSRRYLFNTVLDFFKPFSMIHTSRNDCIEAFIKFAKILGINISPKKKKRVSTSPTNVPAPGKENQEPGIHIVFEDRNKEIIHKDSSIPLLQSKKRRRRRSKKKKIAKKKKKKKKKKITTTKNLSSSLIVKSKLPFGKYKVRDHRPYRKQWKEKRSKSPSKKKKIYLGKVRKIKPARNYSKPWLENTKSVSPSTATTTTSKTKEKSMSPKTRKKVKKSSDKGGRKSTNRGKLNNSSGSYDTSRNRGNYEKPWLDDAYVALEKRKRTKKKREEDEDENMKKSHHKRRSKSAGPGKRRTRLLRYDDLTGEYELRSGLEEDDLIEIKRKKHDERIIDHNHKMYQRRRMESEGRMNRTFSAFDKKGKPRRNRTRISVRSGDFWTVDPRMRMYRSMFGFSDVSTNGVVNTFLDVKPKRIHFV